MDFSILDDDMLPPLNLKAKDQDSREEKNKICEKKTKGEVSNTLTEAQEKRHRVLVQEYGNKCRRNSLNSFPMKLMKILSRDDLQDYISWLPHGRAFCIHQPHTIVNDVLISYFKVSKFRSFTRQLNLWEFKHIAQGKDAGAYYHELFLRGRPKLALFIRRREIKGIDKKMPSNSGKEPNFYDMTTMNPLSCCKDPPLASQKSTFVTTYDTLPKDTEKTSQTGSVDASNSVFGSPCSQRNSHIDHRDVPIPALSSKSVLETILLEQQRQQVVKFLQQASQDSLRRAHQAIEQHRATETLLQRINEADI